MKRILFVLLTVLVTASPAFAGWYLIAPPATQDGTYPWAAKSIWQTMGSFDSAAACQKVLMDMQDISAARWSRMRKKADDLPGIVTKMKTEDSLCVSSDDPRLLERKAEIPAPDDAPAPAATPASPHEAYE